MENRTIKMELINNAAKRIPVCIVVDCSGSMKLTDGTSLSRIDRVNNGIEQFYNESRLDMKTRSSLEISIIEVGSDAKVITDFEELTSNPPKLKWLNQKGDLAKGISLALSMLERRKLEYNQYGIQYWQPWLVVMSDGMPTGEDGHAISRLNDVLNTVRELEELKKLCVFPVFVQGKPEYDSEKNKWIPLSPKGYNDRRNRMLSFTTGRETIIDMNVDEEGSFKKLFKFLHRSASAVASGKGLPTNNEYNLKNYNESKDIPDDGIDEQDEEIPYAEVNEQQAESNGNPNIYDTAANYENSDFKIKKIDDNGDTSIDISNELESLKREMQIEAERLENIQKKLKVTIHINTRATTIALQHDSDILKRNILLAKGDVIKVEKGDVPLKINSKSSFKVNDDGSYEIEVLNTDCNITCIKSLNYSRKISESKQNTHSDFDKILKDIDWDNI